MPIDCDPFPENLVAVTEFGADGNPTGEPQMRAVFFKIDKTGDMCGYAPRTVIGKKHYGVARYELVTSNAPGFDPSLYFAGSCFYCGTKLIEVDDHGNPTAEPRTCEILAHGEVVPGSGKGPASLAIFHDQTALNKENPKAFAVLQMIGQAIAHCPGE